jgi:hypothetical protein
MLCFQGRVRKQNKILLRVLYGNCSSVIPKLKVFVDNEMRHFCMIMDVSMHV